MSNKKSYPCADCGVLRSEEEGAGVFTVCDACWDKAYPKSTANKKVSGVHDLGEMFEFWELKDEISRLLSLYYCFGALDAKDDMVARVLQLKIESLGKKESK